MLVFGESGKPEYPGKTSRSRVENQQTNAEIVGKWSVNPTSEG